MHENDISGIILDAAIEAHRTLGGPGLLESAYEEALTPSSTTCAASAGTPPAR